MVSLILLIVGFALLVWGADKFVAGASALARRLGVSPLLVGLTIVAFGTSAPELAVSVTAAIQGPTKSRSATWSARTSLTCWWSQACLRWSARS